MLERLSHLLWRLSAVSYLHRLNQIKARVLMAKPTEFSLLETLLWTPQDKYFLLNYHWQRLKSSATYFGIPINIEEIQQKLEELVEVFANNSYKVRLIISREGRITCEAICLSSIANRQLIRLSLSQQPIDSTNLFLYHKTTNRQVYDTAKASCPECDDILLWNQRCEITETRIANVIVEINGEYLTPPVKCGLLPGTFRDYLLAQGKVREEVVTIDMLKQCDRIYTINSVRKRQEAILIGKEIERLDYFN